MMINQVKFSHKVVIFLALIQAGSVAYGSNLEIKPKHFYIKKRRKSFFEANFNVKKINFGSSILSFNELEARIPNSLSDEFNETVPLLDLNEVTFFPAFTGGFQIKFRKKF